ncbi:MAG TPA: homoserine kinase [Coriobacteriia bacterium]|jgi:homoserine kinase
MPKAGVRVPASSANLGPGYDSFGLALGLHDLFTAEPADEWQVCVGGEGAGELAEDSGNQVALAMARVFEAAQGAPPAARVVCENGIPTGRGLGSSAAAIVGGLMLGNVFVREPLPKQELFRMAVEMEGHPDNVAAALFGGLTLSWSDDGEPSCALLQPACGLAGVLAVSCAPLATTAARRMLPAEVPHADAAFNAGRAGVLVAGLLLCSPELVSVGLEDRLHEPYRAAAVEDLAAVRKALLDAGADGAALSGAGPTVIGLVTAEDDAAALDRARRVAELTGEALTGSSSRRMPFAVGIDRSGAVLL